MSDRGDADHVVVVVGAGIGGLTAAVELTRRGADVLVLEAAGAPGGRIASVFLDGVAANVGAQWINTGVSELVDEFLERIPQQRIGNAQGGMALVWDGEVFAASGAQPVLPFAADVAKDFQASIDKMSADAALLYEGIDFAAQDTWDYVFDLSMESETWRRLEATSIAAYLAEFDPLVQTIWGTRVSAGFGGTPETTSALFLVGWYRGTPFFPMTILQGGNQRLTDEMHREVVANGGRVHFEAEVTGIEQDATQVTVSCRDGSTHQADHCIVTTPAGVTRSIVSGLPADQDSALSALAYVPLASVAMHITNFPTDERLAGALFVHGRTAAFVSQTGPVAGQPSTGTVILVVVTDPAVVDLPDQQILDLASADLQTIQPGFDARTDIVDYVVRRWPIGEVHISPGFLSAHHHVLGRSHGRVHFGGEYVSNFPTWGGAVWAARRAVREVMDT